MRGDKTGTTSRWTRWVGVVVFGVLGVMVLFGGLGLLGLREHPMRSAIGFALLGYSLLRALINLWLSRSSKHTKLEIH